MALLLGCTGEPLPPAKTNYAGDWRAPDVRLVITPGGHVDYSRKRENATTSINAPIQRFEGDNFVVGVGFLTTTFVVTKPPHLDGALWKMTVDGVELTRGIESDQNA
jgi:hypothetical protein